VAAGPPAEVLIPAVLEPIFQVRLALAHGTEAGGRQTLVPLAPLVPRPPEPAAEAADAPEDPLAHAAGMPPPTTP
jgi:hypothetical protein